MSPDIPDLDTNAHTIQGETLNGDDERRYTRRFQAIMRAARLNNRYPDDRRLSAHVRAMDPDVHRGEYDGLEINKESGLPSYREWTRVQTDASIASDQLRQLGNRSALVRRAAESDHDVHRRQLAKYDYYDDIADTTLAPLGQMEVNLRRVDAQANTAYFHIIFDKLDASGIFIRFAIDLTQTARVWSSPVVEIDDETSSHTDEFQSLIYRFSSLDAEFTYAKLATLSGVTVQSVSRGTVGPFYFGRWLSPAPFDELLSDDPEAFVAHFAIDNAAGDVRENRNNDPFGALFASEVTKRMRSTYARARDEFDYRVYKDRKFVVSRGLEGPLRKLCDAQGTRNIVYSI